MNLHCCWKCLLILINCPHFTPKSAAELAADRSVPLTFDEVDCLRQTISVVVTVVQDQSAELYVWQQVGLVVVDVVQGVKHRLQRLDAA